MQAYSGATGTTYPSWEALVEAESNGYVVVAMLTKGKKSWPWVVGPYPTKREAKNAKARLKRNIDKTAHQYPDVKVQMYAVRPAWKDPR